MKTKYRSIAVLVMGLAAISCAFGQKTTTEYDDMYYIPSGKKAVQPAEKQEVVTPPAKKEAVSDYERYINSLENQQAVQEDVQPAYTDDSLDYATDPNYASGEYSEKDGNTYITNNYYNSDDYYYSSRLRRFYDPFYSAGYFDSWYYDPYYYSPGFSMSMSFGYPYYGYGMGYGNPYYSSWWYPDYYGYGYGSYYNPWYVNRWGYGSYWNGYYNGFYNGYYAGGWYDNQYYANHRPVYYGPRRSIEANRIATASGASATSAYGRRVSTSGASRVATGTTGTEYGRRTVSGGSVARTPNSGTMKSTSGGTVERRPYSSANQGEGTSGGRTTYDANGRRTVNSGTATQEDRSYNAQDRPVYTRPSTTTTQNRSTYSTGREPNSGNRTAGSTEYSRPSGSGSSYSRPSSSGSTYSRPSSSGSSGSYSRPSSSGSSSGSYSRSSSGSSYSGGSSGGSYSGGSSSSGSSGGGSRSSSGGGGGGGGRR